MPSYCKAYQVKDLKKFSGWNGSLTRELQDEDICYVWPDFTVTRSCLGEEKDRPLIKVTPEWEAFCKETLQFRVPDDLKGD